MNASRRAYTLLEILLVIAILSLLAAIVVAATAPIRESARQQHCMSNLRQWGLATALYRADWDGQEPVLGEPMQYWQLGLPGENAHLEAFVDTYSGRSLLHDCPDYHSRAPLSTIWSTYIWIPASDNPNAPGVFQFSNLVAKRGDQTPILTDENHNPLPPDVIESLSPRWETKRVLVLRLSGQAQNELVPVRESYLKW